MWFTAQFSHDCFCKKTGAFVACEATDEAMEIIKDCKDEGAIAKFSALRRGGYSIRLQWIQEPNSIHRQVMRLWSTKCFDFNGKLLLRLQPTSPELRFLYLNLVMVSKLFPLKILCLRLEFLEGALALWGNPRLGFCSKLDTKISTGRDVNYFSAI